MKVSILTYNYVSTTVKINKKREICSYGTQYETKRYNS